MRTDKTELGNAFKYQYTNRGVGMIHAYRKCYSITVLDRLSLLARTIHSKYITLNRF